MKIAVISPNKARMEDVRKILQDGSSPRQVLLFEGGIERLALVAAHEHPDLVFMDGICQGTEELGVLEQIGLQSPGIALILLCENATSEFLIGALRIGVKDVLHLPMAPEALQQAVQRVEHKSKPVAAPQAMGKVIVFIPCKGGSGSTFLACNLSYILAAAHGAKVALLDLNLQFGDAALFLSDLTPLNTVADVADNIARLDASFLASSMVQVLPNFWVLAAPEGAGRADDVKPVHVDALLKLARTQYDYVILDLGRLLNATSVKALDHADLIFPVLQQTLPFIRDSKQLIHALQALGYARDKIHLIINRHEKGGDVRQEDVEATLGMKVFKTVPNSYETVSASVNQGVPIMKIARNDPVTKALQEVAQKLTEVPRTGKGGWLAHLLHRT